MNVFRKAHLVFARSNMNLALEKLDNAILDIKSTLEILKGKYLPSMADIQNLESELRAIEDARATQQIAIDQLTHLINIE